jgi:hypothetical protein
MEFIDEHRGAHGVESGAAAQFVAVESFGRSGPPQMRGVAGNSVDYSRAYTKGT